MIYIMMIHIMLTHNDFYDTDNVWLCFCSAQWKTELPSLSSTTANGTNHDDIMQDGSERDESERSIKVRCVCVCVRESDRTDNKCE